MTKILSILKKRIVAHFDLDSFFVSVEVLKNSTLKNKPIALGGKGDRGVVSACSYEARAFGIRSGIPMRTALQLCPELLQIKGDPDQYSYYSNIVTDIVSEDVPLYEKMSIDEFYIDLTGMDKFFGTYKFTKELREKIIRETGLPISFGLSTNKTVAKVATNEGKPNGEKKVNSGYEKYFLAPLVVNKIPYIGHKTSNLLQQMGVEYVRTIQEMPAESFHHLLGKKGLVLWKRASGIDDSPVAPYTERKSISLEQTFHQDTIDVEMLNSILIGMTEKLAIQLRQEKKLTACIAVKIRYSNFDTHTQQMRIRYNSCDHVLIKGIKELFKKLYNRRMLIRLIGVKFSHLVYGNYQIDLFEDSLEMINLYKAMDNVNKRYGLGAVKRAVSISSRENKINSFHNKSINNAK